jgi:hypothetical protein
MIPPSTRTDIKAIDNDVDTLRRLGRYQVEPKSLADFGLYECIPRSMAGTAKCDIHIELGATPNPPEKCTVQFATVNNKTFAQFSCRPGFNQGGLSSFLSIYELSVPGKELKLSGRVNIDENNVDQEVPYITPADKNNYYEFIIMQENNYGNSTSVLLTLGSPANKQGMGSLASNRTIFTVVGVIGAFLLLLFLCACCCCSSGLSNKSDCLLCKCCGNGDNDQDDSSTYKKANIGSDSDALVMGSDGSAGRRSVYPSMFNTSGMSSNSKHHGFGSQYEYYDNTTVSLLHNDSNYKTMSSQKMRQQQQQQKGATKAGSTSSYDDQNSDDMMNEKPMYKGAYTMDNHYIDTNDLDQQMGIDEEHYITSVNSRYNKHGLVDRYADKTQKYRQDDLPLGRGIHYNDDRFTDNDIDEYDVDNIGQHRLTTRDNDDRALNTIDNDDSLREYDNDLNYNDYDRDDVYMDQYDNDIDTARDRDRDDDYVMQQDERDLNRKADKHKQQVFMQPALLSNAALVGAGGDFVKKSTVYFGRQKQFDNSNDQRISATATLNSRRGNANNNTKQINNYSTIDSKNLKLIKTDNGLVYTSINNNSNNSRVRTKSNDGHLNEDIKMTTMTPSRSQQRYDSIKRSAQNNNSTYSNVKKTTLVNNNPAASASSVTATATQQLVSKNLNFQTELQQKLNSISLSKGDNNNTTNSDKETNIKATLVHAEQYSTATTSISSASSCASNSDLIVGNRNKGNIPTGSTASAKRLAESNEMSSNTNNSSQNNKTTKPYSLLKTTLNMNGNETTNNNNKPSILKPKPKMNGIYETINGE